MIENKKEFKSTIEAFIQAKREIKSIVNNKEAFNFKFANLVVVQEEVNRVLENKGLDMISMEHIETEHFPRIYKT
ncbi:hypothetical protein KPH14_012952 [Odynerus spinipes]|uniref:Uncharacterized protein n=1 Tax=Odynerus spinipes TaxID=1348599 RepID=A0AAD9R806_9HYME|nr:hypothetical protein KPH14_012952 [Odynerus spinipes]